MIKNKRGLLGHGEGGCRQAAAKARRTEDAIKEEAGGSGDAESAFAGAEETELKSLLAEYLLQSIFWDISHFLKCV